VSALCARCPMGGATGRAGSGKGKVRARVPGWTRRPRHALARVPLLFTAALLSAVGLSSFRVGAGPGGSWEHDEGHSGTQMGRLGGEELLTDSEHFSSADRAPGAELSDTPSFHGGAVEPWEARAVGREPDAAEGMGKAGTDPALLWQPDFEPRLANLSGSADIWRAVAKPKRVKSKARNEACVDRGDDGTRFDTALQRLDEELEQEALGPVENISMVELVIDMGVVSEQQLLEGVEIPPIVWQRHLQQQRLLARHRRLFPPLTPTGFAARSEGPLSLRIAPPGSGEASGEGLSQSIATGEAGGSGSAQGAQMGGTEGRTQPPDLALGGRVQPGVPSKGRDMSDGSEHAQDRQRAHSRREEGQAVEGKEAAVAAGGERKISHDRYDSDDSWLVTSSEIDREARAAQQRYLQALDPSIGACAARGGRRRGGGARRKKLPLKRKAASFEPTDAAGIGNSSALRNSHALLPAMKQPCLAPSRPNAPRPSSSTLAGNAVHVVASSPLNSNFQH
jgi:hypothetical protein